MKSPKAEYVDPHPERSEAGFVRIARILGISERHCRRLASQGVLTAKANGLFDINGAVDAFVEYRRPKPEDASHDAYLRRQEQILARRLARQAEGEIAMQDALETFDIVTTAFMRSIEIIRDQIGGDPRERERVAAICAGLAKGLERRFAQERRALETGVRE